jgi:hypothetical protein
MTIGLARRSSQATEKGVSEFGVTTNLSSGVATVRKWPSWFSGAL